tara:strand:+ start:537 stop:755 length:219 start_codon:yes stop_codon:yes gene_type:complete
MSPRAVRRTESVRDVPTELTDMDRISYLAVARRAQTEGAHAYAVLSLGLQAYVTAARIERSARENAPAASTD